MSAMIRSRRIAAALACALVGSTVASAADAASGWLDPSPPQLAPQHLFSPPGVSLEQATEAVRRHTGGRVLSASPAERGGAQGFEVRVLVDGKRVRNVFVDHEGQIRFADVR